MENISTKYNRHSLRLTNYDYSNKGLYFITICVENCVSLFGEVFDGELKLNLFGEIAKEEWLRTDQIRDNVQLHEFIIMPNHIHGIIKILFSKDEKKSQELNQIKSPSQSIGAIIRGYKGATTKKIRELINNKVNVGLLKNDTDIVNTMDWSKSIWQRSFHDHIIRNKKDYCRIAEYIENNPFLWVYDKYYNG